MTPRRIVATAVAVGLSVATLVACGSDKFSEQYKDADRGETNSTPADTITFPDGFSNVANKCDGPNMVYVIFHENGAYGSVAVAPNDPRCVTP